MNTMDRNELKERLQDHTAWVKSLKTNNPGEAGERLHLINVNLNGADLQKADLRNAIFAFCSLNGAQLNRANLSDASFYKSYCGEANFQGSKLTHASLSYTNLTSANLTSVKARKCVFDYACCVQTTFDKGDLSYASFTQANLKNASFKFTNLFMAYLAHARVKNTDFKFSVFPWSCGSARISADDAFMKMMLAHFAALNYVGMDNQLHDLHKQVKALLKTSYADCFEVKAMSL